MQATDATSEAGYGEQLAQDGPMCVKCLLDCCIFKLAVETRHAPAGVLRSIRRNLLVHQVWQLQLLGPQLARLSAAAAGKQDVLLLCQHADKLGNLFCEQSCSSSSLRCCLCCPYVLPAGDDRRGAQQRLHDDAEEATGGGHHAGKERAALWLLALASAYLVVELLPS